MTTPIKKYIQLCFLLVTYLATPFSASAQNEKVIHSFKIAGPKKMQVLGIKSSQKLVEYSDQKSDHLFISDFTRNGSIYAKTEYLFKGDRFELASQNQYYSKNELILDGVQLIYSEDKSLASESKFSNGKLQEQTIFYANGEKKMMYQGDEKVLNGEFKMWYPDGHLNLSGNFKNNLKDGFFESFDKAGNSDRKGTYREGKLISGQSVVLDVLYEEPDVPAEISVEESALDEYLKNKTANLECAKTIEGHLLYDLKFTIDKTGHVINIQSFPVIFPKYPEIPKALITDFPVFKPAKMEDVPVSSTLILNFILSNKGLESDFHRSDPVVIDSANIKTYESLGEEEMPKYPGGQLALRKFIAMTVRYPVYAQEHGIMGKVFVNFIISESGKVTQISVVKSVHPILDDEAVRVVKNMPRWIPGSIKGKPVSVSYTVPINFQLQ